MSVLTSCERVSSTDERADTLYRAANDNGDCTTAFDPQCVEDLRTQAAQLALGLVSSPTPNPGSNLTQGSLSHVCYDIGNLLEADFPQTCNKYFNGTATCIGSGKPQRLPLSYI